MTGILNLLAGAVSSVVKDTYFNLVSLLLPGDGTNGAQNNTFLDSSSNNFTITRNGNTTQGTFSPFSQTGWSNYFDGSGDYLTAPDNAAFGFGTGDWTIECFFNTFNSAKTNNCLVDFRSNGGGSNQAKPALNIQSNNLNFISTGSTRITTPVSSDQWYHVAVCRVSGSTKMYLNGVQVGATYTDATNYGSNNDVVVGEVGDSRSFDGWFAGYISNLRIVKGTAVYTAAFTPPTEPLTAITNTSLLTCQSNRFVDNSTNAFAITVNGNTSVQAFSPFAPTAAYSAATVGGSGYFDGSGDYLTIAGNSAFNLNTSGTAWLVEVFFYPTATANYTLISQGEAVWRVATTSGGKVNWSFGASTSATVDNYVINQWNHFAVCYDGTNYRLYLNGKYQAVGGLLPVTDTTTTIYVGVNPNSGGVWLFNGYLSGVRVVKGASASIYTSTTTITVPTAPFTAITGTSLLTNFTNAGITDATAKNVLETVGNAQISTTQSKFGGSSMSFDGTGDRLLAPTSPQYELGAGNWTIECWVYANSLSSILGIFAKRGNADSEVRWINARINTNGTIYTEVSVSNSSWGIQSSTTTALSATTWTHVAWVRNGSDVSVYVNGTKNTLSSGFTSSVFNGTEPFVLGANGTSGSSFLYQMNGYIDDFRITRYARYTANFTPPATAFALQ